MPHAPVMLPVSWTAAAKGTAGDEGDGIAGCRRAPFACPAVCLEVGVCSGWRGRWIKCRAEQKAGRFSKQRTNPVSYKRGGKSFINSSFLPKVT